MLYILATILLGLSAVNTGNNLLFMVVSALLAFMSLTGIAGMQNIRRLNVSIRPLGDVTAGTESLFSVHIANTKTFLPSFVISITCGDSAPLPVSFIPSGGAVEERLALTFPVRGMHDSGLIRVSSAFPVGFFIRFLVCESAANVLVFPKPERGEGKISPDDEAMPGCIAVPERGGDGELERVGEYSGRESLRFIHWKATARSADIMVKEMGTLVNEPLLIDLSSTGPERFEEEICHAAWLVHRWGGARPVGLILRDGKIDPGIGVNHVRVLLSKLAMMDGPKR